MEDTPPDFDAADLADAILGAQESDEPTTELPVTAAPSGRPNGKGSHLGTVLFVLLAIAVSVAISLAVQLDDPSSPRATPPCGGLYSDCCAEWDDNWGPCIEPCDRDRPDDRERRDNGRGLFDAEEHFADNRLPPRC